MQNMETLQISCVWILCMVASLDAVLLQKDSKISHIQMKPMIYNSGKSQRQTIELLKPEKLQEVAKQQSMSNHDVFRSLGLSQQNIQPGHHRKRLAIESHHHARADDSHMFIIKLPPNQQFYTFNKQPSFNKNSFDDSHKKVPVGFNSNGKPDRIYHWNIPVMKKIVGKNQGRRRSSFRHVEDNVALIDIKHIPTWSQPWENEAIDKASKHRHDKYKKKSPSYYAPIKSRQTNFNKYFTNNGKPQSFYVIGNKKPTSYHQLIQ